VDHSAIKYDVAAKSQGVFEFIQQRRVNILLTIADQQDTLGNFWRNRDRPKLSLQLPQMFARKPKQS
jgi:hypothetical protein